MTKNLKDAFTEASKLSEQEQDELAKWLLAELASERRWSNAFRESADRLSSLADEALGEHRAGSTEDLEPSSL